MKPSIKRAIRICLLIVLGVIVFIALTVAWSFFDMHVAPFRGEDFDQTVWITFHESMKGDNPRGAMATDLRTNYLRVGMTQEEVLSLLGEPDWDRSKTVFKYNLGAWSGFRIDYDSLDIHFDLNGHVTHTEIRQH